LHHEYNWNLKKYRCVGRKYGSKDIIGILKNTEVLEENMGCRRILS